MASEKLHILAIGAHPDDVELSCSGTLLREIEAGRRCGILHLTKGEMGTRGDAETRLKESRASAALMGVAVLEQLDLADCGMESTPAQREPIIKMIRKYQPDIVLCNTMSDRHPDHGHAGRLVEEACFYAGLSKLVTKEAGVIQHAFRPRLVLHYAQDRVVVPDLVVDITPFMKKKMEAIRCYASQFHDPNSKEPETAISRQDFLSHVEGKARTYGREIGVEFGEAFTCSRPLGSTDLGKII